MLEEEKEGKERRRKERQTGKQARKQKCKQESILIIILNVDLANNLIPSHPLLF